MGCCESRNNQEESSKLPKEKNLPKEKKQADTAPSSAEGGGAPMQDFSRPRKMKSVSFKDEIEIDVGAIPFAIKTFAELDDNEVLDRLNFADECMKDPLDWTEEFRDICSHIKTKVKTFRDITSRVVVTEVDFGINVPTSLVIDLLNHPHMRQSWDKNMSLIETEGHDFNDYLVFSRIEIMFIYKKYLVERRLTRRHNNAVAILYYSLNYPPEKVPAKIKSGATLVNTILGVNYIKQYIHTTKLTMVSMLEPDQQSIASKLAITGIKNWSNYLKNKVYKEIDSEPREELSYILAKY
jgi:hypothetical protein